MLKQHDNELQGPKGGVSNNEMILQYFRAVSKSQGSHDDYLKTEQFSKAKGH